MNTARATLGGVPLTAARTVTWSLQAGYDPVQRVFECHKSVASQLDAKVGQPITLSITTTQGATLEFKKLYIVGQMPSTHPFLRAYLVADVRWLWRRLWVYRYFNVPRRTGDTFLIEGDPVAVAAQDDEILFADWSIRPGKKKWTPKQAIENVGQFLCQKADTSFTIDDPISDSLPIQALELDDDGPSALARVMAKAPGFMPKVHADGSVHAFNTRAITKADQLLQQRIGIVGAQEPARASLQAIRPSKIHVLIQREVELRFDSVTEDESPTISANDLYCDNVLPVPDTSLTLSDGRTVARGTWIAIREAIAAWNNDLPHGAEFSSPPLTFDLIRKLWLRQNALEALYTGLGVLAPDVNWIARIATLREHFRQTYRISQRWMRRIKGLRNYRVAVFDVLTGVRSPTSVLTDYCVMPARKTYLENPDQQYVWLNVHGYPGVGGNPDKDGAKCPATVEILDQDIGILHVNFASDPTGRWTQNIPSLVVDEGGHENVVQVNMARWRNRPIALDAKVFGTNTGVELSSSHKVCMILTAIPAAPNDETQFHKITLEPGQFTSKLPSIERSTTGTGPEWTVRLNGQIIQARIAWKQSRAGLTYEGMFGLPGVPPPDPASLQELLVNSKALNEMATSKAASVWSMLIDRYEGQRVTHMDGVVNPAGNIDIVTFTLNTNGSAYTELSASPHVSGIDPFAMLPDSVRTAVLGLVPQG